MNNDYGKQVLESVLEDIKNMSDGEFEKYMSSDIDQDYIPIVETGWILRNTKKKS